MADSKRIRVVFEDDDILSEAQKLEGLNRSWLMLKPNHQHATVSDIASHLLDAFQLHHSCPNGLLLSSSGFVLPQFESTSILKEDEVIIVHKRRNFLSLEGINVANDLQKLESVKRQEPVETGMMLLANEEFEKEKGGYESDDTEDEPEEQVKEDPSHAKKDRSCSKQVTIKRKRKAPEKLRGSKKKKHRSEASDVVETLKEKKSHSQEETKVASNDDDNVGHNEESATLSEKNDVSMTDVNGNDEVEDSKVIADTAPEETKKRASRSARRKYKKRAWLREMAKIQKTAGESEGLRNWNADHSKSEGREDHTKVERNKCDQSKGPKWKRQRADMEKTEEGGHPKGLLHWSGSPQNSPSVRDKIRPQQTSNFCFPNRPNHKCDVAEPISSTRKFSKEAEALVKEARQEQMERLLQQEKYNQNGDIAKETLLVGNGDEQSNQGGIHEQANGGNTDVNEQSSQQIGDAQQQPDKNGNASESNEESDEDKEVVPVVIRPGHIRFEPLSKEEAVQQNHELTDTFQWNGITSKKKGQKWGTEKGLFSQRNDHESSGKDFSESSKIQKQHDIVIDFEKLPPLPSMPKEGDLIAYRVLELSSSWTPEFSAYRIGKVAYFNAGSNKTILVPVPDHPLVSKTDEEESVQLDSSLYKEDGTLEVDFSSLIDVRMFKHGTSESTNGPSSHVSGVSLVKENTPKPVLNGSNRERGLEDSPVVKNGLSSQSEERELPVTGNGSVIVKENGQSGEDTEMQSPAAGKGGVDPWDQISEALNAKKAELANESSWGKPGKKLQVVQHNYTWGVKIAKNIQASSPPLEYIGKNAQHSPINNSWGKKPRFENPLQGSSEEKNGETSQENSWGKQNSWSYKALRGSGLGQTMDMLRSKK